MIVNSHAKLQINVWMFVCWWKWQSGIKGTPPPPNFPAVLRVVSVREKKPWYKKGLDCRLCLSRLASRIHLLIFLYGFISLSPECLLNFLSKMYIPPCLGKIFKFMEFTFLEDALICYIHWCIDPLPWLYSFVNNRYHKVWY